MASRCSRMMNRASISSIKTAIRSNIRTASKTPMDGSAPKFPLPSRSTSSPLRRFSLCRSPSELGCVQSLLPLHSAVAAARMTSRLSSRSCIALSQDRSGQNRRDLAKAKNGSSEVLEGAERVLYMENFQMGKAILC